MDEVREVPVEVRRHIWWSNATWPALVIVLMWALYVAAAAFGFDVLAWLKRRQHDPAFERQLPTVLLWAATGVTILCIGWATFLVRRAMKLAREGVEVVAKVTRVGSLSMQGWVRVDYEYTCNGHYFRKAMSCVETDADEYRTGTKPLVLVCDPARPSRAMLRSDVWPDAVPAPEGFASEPGEPRSLDDVIGEMLDRDQS